jgi:hypothetical protein
VVCAGKALFGLTFAEGTPALWAVAVVGGLALAFLPARFVLAALGDLWRMVR